tara:strand:+ start:365 stop:586 length:222 start_codon:yes stop_codon:yes gene_type:complete
VAESEYLPGEHAAQSGRLSLSQGFDVPAATLNHVMVDDGSEDDVPIEHKHWFVFGLTVNAVNAHLYIIIEHDR